MAKTQEARQVTVTSPLGDDVLLFGRLVATEELGRLFTYELTVTSEDSEINFDEIVGRKVTIELERPDGGLRYFNGFVSSFVQVSGDADLSEYKATLVPWLWFLTRTTDCRIFQDKTVPEIIEAVFDDNGFGGLFDLTSLLGSYRKWVYCVQYRETDFNFVSRLMEQEGIYYYFEHSDDKHVLVLSDDVTAHQAYEGYEEIPYRPEGTAEDMEHITGWTLEQKIQPGAFAHTDYDFKDSKKDLAVTKSVSRNHTAANGEVFDYPGVFIERSDGEDYATVRIQEMQAQHEEVSSSSDACGICAGYTFKLVDHPRDDQCREYLVKKTTITVESEDYRSAGSGDAGTPMLCTFTAIDSTTPYRSERITPKPIIQGPQTAVVVGGAAEEIKNSEGVWTDEYGRVKVRFHWDRVKNENAQCGCWVRVSQNWAGKTWGGMFIPHIGQEVIVEHLEGDPDRPIITGRVYNNSQMPALTEEEREKNTTNALPAGKYVSIIQDNYHNQMYFDATPDDEHVLLHSPNTRSSVELGRGKGVRITSDADAEHITVGNTYELKIGHHLSCGVGFSASGYVGGQASFFLGGSAGLWVGASMDFTLGVKGSWTWGGSYSYYRGYKYENVSGKSITATDNDIIVRSKTHNIIIDAKKDVRILGGKKDNSVFKGTDDAITISYGENTKDIPTPVEDKTKKTMKKAAAAQVAAVAGASLATASAMALGVKLLGDKDDSDKMKDLDTAAWTTALVVGGATCVTGLCVAYYQMSKLNKDEPKINPDSRQTKTFSRVTLNKDMVHIAADPNIPWDKLKGNTSIVVNKSGTIQIKAQKIIIDAKSMLTLKAGSKIVLDAPMIDIA